MASIQTLHQGLEGLRQWVGLWLPVLLLPLLLWFRWPWLTKAWGFLLDQKWGRFWPVPAAILPALIAIASKNAPDGLNGPIVAVLLLAVAVLQLYGQQLDNKDREQQIHERDQQAAEINSIGAGVDSIGSEVKQQGAQLRSVADGVGGIAAYLAAKEEEESGS